MGMDVLSARPVPGYSLGRQVPGRRLMFSYAQQGRGGHPPVQGEATQGWATRLGRNLPAATFYLVLSGCAGSPASTPLSWWHDLQGGVIAENRPPPPGADLPYPHLGTIPPKPILPGTSYRDSIKTSLAQERDDTERVAARTPLEVTPPNPLPEPIAGTSTAPAGEAASASLPGADAKPPPPAAPPAAPTNVGDAAPAAPPGKGGAPDGPPPGTELTIAGDPLTEATPNLPAIPEAPPAPASFDGAPVQRVPPPPPPLPQRLPPSLAGTPILFAPGSAVLDPSQTQPLKDFLERRGKQGVDVEGHGDTRADSPAAQEQALQLGLQRAHAIAKQLAALHVPGDKIHLAATAFGRDATLRLVP